MKGLASLISFCLPPVRQLSPVLRMLLSYTPRLAHTDDDDVDDDDVLQNNKPLVQDLFEDLRDGEVLLSLLEILTAQQYVSTTPSTPLLMLHIPIT